MGKDYSSIRKLLTAVIFCYFFAMENKLKQRWCITFVLSRVFHFKLTVYCYFHSLSLKAMILLFLFLNSIMPNYSLSLRSPIFIICWQAYCKFLCQASEDEALCFLNMIFTFFICHITKVSNLLCLHFFR